MERNIRMIVLILIASVVLLSACGGHKVRVVPTAEVPAADANAKIGTDDNGNTKVDLEVEHLASPASLPPPATAYVVWFQPSGEAAQNKGVLKVGDDLKGKFKAVTPYKSLELIVTAEGDPRATMPSGRVIMRQQLTR